MKKRIVTILLCMSILTTGIMPVFAAPDTAEETAETEDTGDEETESPEDTEEVSTEDNSEETDTGEAAAEGDELDVITKTEKNEVNNCQISITGTMPEGFTLDFYIEFQNKSTNQVYRMTAYHSNDYIARMFVPEGNYYVNDCTVWNDNTGKFPLVIPEDFTATKNGNVVLETTLVNYDDVENEANERLHPGEESEIEEKDMYSDIMPWQRLEHTGTGGENVYKKGTCTEKLDVVIRVVKSGKPKEAEIQLSVDNGETFSENQLMPGTLAIDYTDEKGKYHETGAKVTFADEEYVEGDTYTLHTEHEFSVSNTCVGSGNMRAYENLEIGTIPQEINLYVLIKSTGRQGEATFTYSYSGEAGPFNDKLKTIPEDGIINLPSIGTTLQFYNEGEYKVGDAFSVTLQPSKIKKNYTAPVLITIFVIVMIIAIGYIYLLSFRESESNYNLQVYDPVTLPEKKKKRKEKKK